MTTGVTGATISYDFETDPWGRERDPSFYGYIPANAKKRTIIFIIMVFASATTIVARCTSILLLALVDKNFAYAFLFVDLGLYLLVKILRGDFFYHLPLHGAKDLFTSFLVRAVNKLVNDYTSIVQLRQPNELGGFYWSFGLLLTLASLLISASVFERQNSGEDAEKVNLVWNSVIVIIPFACLLWSAFILLIERSHLASFITLRRGKNLTVQFFHENYDDALKSIIFRKNIKHWRSFEGEVQS